MEQSTIKIFKKIIQEEIEKFFEDFNFDNSNKSFPPSDEMINNCKQALKIVKKQGLPSGGNEGSGKEKAVSIVNKEPINHSMLKRMKAFFDNNEDQYRKEVNSGKTIKNSPIIQKWNLWGGDAGKELADKNIARTKDRNLKRKDLRRQLNIHKTSTLMDPTNTRIKR